MLLWISRRHKSGYPVVDNLSQIPLLRMVTTRSEKKRIDELVATRSVSMNIRLDALYKRLFPKPTKWIELDVMSLAEMPGALKAEVMEQGDYLVVSWMRIPEFQATFWVMKAASAGSKARLQVLEVNRVARRTVTFEAAMESMMEGCDICFAIENLGEDSYGDWVRAHSLPLDEENNALVLVAG